MASLTPVTIPPSRLHTWPRPFDPASELDWGDPVVSRRLLREHLDQAHDGASRREVVIDGHVRRLRRLVPEPPAHLLDAASGPGLYAVRLARAGYAVTAIDVGAASVRHATKAAASAGLAARLRARRADLRTFTTEERYDAVLLIYHVLEGFERRAQPAVLRRLGAVLRDPSSPLVVEMRLRPDQPDGRISSWEVVPFSLLSDRPHLLLVETVYDRHLHTYILRETAVFDDGSTAVQQTSSALTRLELDPGAVRPRRSARGGRVRRLVALPGHRPQRDGRGGGAAALRRRQWAAASDAVAATSSRAGAGQDTSMVSRWYRLMRRPARSTTSAMARPANQSQGGAGLGATGAPTSAPRAGADVGTGDGDEVGVRGGAVGLGATTGKGARLVAGSVVGLGTGAAAARGEPTPTPAQRRIVVASTAARYRGSVLLFKVVRPSMASTSTVVQGTRRPHAPLLRPSRATYHSPRSSTLRPEVPQ